MKIFFVLVILMIPFLSGCWSRVEVNDIAIVTAEGVDKMGDGKIRVALQVAIPRLLGPAGQGGGGGQDIGAKSTWVVSEKGETIMDAYRKLQEKLSRRIFFSQSHVVVIGEKLGRNGLAPILDFFTRYREARMNKYILFTRGEALRILKFVPKLEKVPAEIMREEVKSKIGVKVNLKDFVDMLIAEGEEPIAAEIELVPSNEKREKKSSKQVSPSQVETNLSLKGAAVFKKDKLIGWMDDKETRGVLWLRNKIKTGVVTVNIPKNKGNGKISVQILNAQTKIIPTLKDGKVFIEVKARAEDDLYESSAKMDLGNPGKVQFVESKLKDDIIKRIQLALDKAQKKYKSDIFGFGRAVEMTYPKEWRNTLVKRWDQEFPHLKVKVTANVTIQRTGLTNKPLIWEEKEFKK